MTREQAEAKIKEIHPEDGYIYDRQTDGHDCDWRGVARFYVGHSNASKDNKYGNGNSWHEAFVDLVRRSASK